jgi:hypothetical protein
MVSLLKSGKFFPLFFFSKRLKTLHSWVDFSNLEHQKWMSDLLTSNHETQLIELPSNLLVRVLQSKIIQPLMIYPMLACCCLPWLTFVKPFSAWIAFLRLKGAQNWRWDPDSSHRHNLGTGDLSTRISYQVSTSFSSHKRFNNYLWCSWWPPAILLAISYHGLLVSRSVSTFCPLSHGLRLGLYPRSFSILI